jgi:SAM-dependent methyltransferase
MRKPIWNYVKLAIDTLPIAEPVYEFGAYQVEEAPENCDLRPLLTGKAYVGCDMRAGPGVDKVLNLHQIDLPDGSVGTVFLMDTLEHVEYPHQAMAEVHRILKPDGMVIMSSVLDFFIHATPNDFWRFTPDGFRSLLKQFRHSHVGYYGRDIFPHTLVGTGFKGEAPNLENYLARYRDWSEKQTRQVEKISLQDMRSAIAKANSATGLNKHV